MAQEEPVKSNASPSLLSNSIPQLPAPQTFDILPPLHELLARIDAHQNQGRALSIDPSIQSDNELGSSYGGDLQPLDPKELSTAVLDIKSRVRRALRELEKLPEMDRSVAELDEEVAELEAKIARQQGVLNQLRVIAGKAGEKLR